MERKLEEIDEILVSYEDWMHGINGEQCTKARKLLAEVQQQLKILNMPVVSGSLPEVTLMNEQKLGDTFINWKELSPEKQWQRIDAMLHEIGLKVVRQ